MSAKKSKIRPSSFFLGQLKLWAPCTVSPFIQSAGRNEAATPFEFRGRARQMDLKKENDDDTHIFVNGYFIIILLEKMLSIEYFLQHRREEF